MLSHFKYFAECRYTGCRYAECRSTVAQGYLAHYHDCLFIFVEENNKNLVVIAVRDLTC